MKRALAIALAATTAGCFSLIPLPSGKKSSGPKKPMHVNGKLFGTGTTQVAAWDVALDVAPEIAVVTENAYSLKVTNFREDGDTMVGGEFALYIRVRRPNDAADEYLRPQTGIVTDDEYQLGQEIVDEGKTTFLGFEAVRYALIDKEHGAFSRVVVTGIHGNCIYQLIVGDTDTAVMEQLANDGLAAVRGIAGATPEPAACQ